jgi:hypothetical protein
MKGSGMKSKILNLKRGDYIKYVYGSMPAFYGIVLEKSQNHTKIYWIQGDFIQLVRNESLTSKSTTVLN